MTTLPAAGYFTASGRKNSEGKQAFDAMLAVLRELVESTAPSSAAGTLTLDITTGNDFDVTLSENVTTLAVTGWSPSGTFGKITIRLAQDATGSRTFAFPAAWKWPGGTPPTLPTGPNEDIELEVWTRDAGATIYAAEVGQKFA